MITLAVATGVSAEQWAKEGARTIATAMQIVEERNALIRAMSTSDTGRDDSRVYSG